MLVALGHDVHTRIGYVEPLKEPSSGRPGQLPIGLLLDQTILKGQVEPIIGNLDLGKVLSVVVRPRQGEMFHLLGQLTTQRRQHGKD